MKELTLRRTLRLKAPITEVFEFFSNARNLEAITPPWLRFHVASQSTPELGNGSLIDYHLKIRGIPIKWTSEISDWEPPIRFTDSQVRGPYRKWIHVHSFASDGDETICGDHVDYSVFGGRLIDRLFVRRDLNKIFDYRTHALQEHFDLR